MAGVGNAGVISDMDVRVFLRDADPDANLLLDDYEFTAEELRSAMNLIVDKWNETVPTVGSYQVESFPWRYHMLIGTCANLLRMAGYRYQRNDLPYQIGGGVVNDQSKAQSYHATADRLAAEFDAWMRLKKSSIQADIGWGTV